MSVAWGHNSKPERNQLIKNLRAGGSTLKVIAEQFGISIERVRSIAAPKQERAPKPEMFKETA